MKLLLLLTIATLSAACSPATTDTPAADQATAQDHGGKKGKKGHKKKKKDQDEDGADDQPQALPNGLRQVGTLPANIRESSGLCAAPQAGSYFTFGDDGNPPVVFRIDGTGHELDNFTVGAPNHDWESLSRDNGGNYYLGDCGNNNSDRRDLAILRFRPGSPGQVGRIAFTYPRPD